MRNDLRHAVRVLLKAKGWTTVVLVSLALGIGANTALFSAVNGLFLRPLPVDDPDELVRLRWTGENDAARNTTSWGYTGRTSTGDRISGSFSYPMFEALRDANETLSGMFAGTPTEDLNLVIDGIAEIGAGFAASGDFFRVLGVPALEGRVLLPDDDRPGAEPVTMISHRFWERRFGLDPAAVGTVLQVNGEPTTIVGILPPGFTGITRAQDAVADLHLPLRAARGAGGEDRLSDPTFWWLSFMEGLTPEQRALRRNQDRRAAPRLLVDSAAQGLYDASPRAIRQARMLGVVMVLVLLIVCANVATLLLSRAFTRRREIAVRLSVGATRGRLVRQLVTESLLLSAAGGALAVPVALGARELLPFGQAAPFDWRVLGFVSAVSVVAGVTFSLVPALRATTLELTGALKEQSRSVVASRSALSRTLLVGQVAVSLALLVGAGLFLKTVVNLRNVDVGFNPENVLLFSLDPTRSGYDREGAVGVFDRIGDRLRTLPGVRSVTRSQLALLSGGTWTSTLFAEGRTDDGVQSHMMTVSHTFLDTMEIPLLSGRGFEPQDQADAPRVALVNQTMARELFGEDSPLGRRFGSSPEERDEVEIIGVVRDTRYDQVREPAPPTTFRSAVQSPLGNATFSVRTDGPPGRLIPAVREAVRQVDPRLPITGVSTQAAEVEQRLGDERLYAVAYTTFGGLATLLAGIGLFGLASYGVTQRTNEIGIRMALGAQASSIARLVLGESLVLVAIGVVAGVGTVLVAGRLVTSLLFGLAPTDPLTMLQATALLVVVAGVASYLPARRAARIDPLVALQDE